VAGLPLVAHSLRLAVGDGGYPTGNPRVRPRAGRQQAADYWLHPHPAHYADHEDFICPNSLRPVGLAREEPKPAPVFLSALLCTFGGITELA